MLETDWDEQHDVVIVGSGGGALTGAVTAAHGNLDTIVIEKSDVYGGTTAYAGAGLWLPNSSVSESAGVEDSPRVAREYLREVLGVETSEDLQDAFVESAPDMVEFLQNQCGIKFEWRPFPDYFPYLKSASADGRDIFPCDLPAELLGDMLDSVRPTANVDRFGAQRERSNLTGGQALIGRLLLSLVRYPNVHLHTNMRMTGLITTDNTVFGVRARDDQGQAISIRARQGVLLASGGFEHNWMLRCRYQDTSPRWSMGAPTNTGDALVAGLAVGGQTDLLDECWWSPGLLLPDESAAFIYGLRGGLVVNRAGKRFGNESLPYDQFGRLMRQASPQNTIRNVPAYLVFDSRFGTNIFTKYTPDVHDSDDLISAGVWKVADTIQDLAREIAVDPEALIRSVNRFNEFARRGVDADFGRGESSFDQFFATTTGGNPSLTPVDRSPYLAATIVVTDLGTKGGLCTDSASHVLRPDGSVIKGLYAAGNTSKSITGRHYPGPGMPIATSMVFSYRAVRDIMTRTHQVDRVNSLEER